MSHKKKQSINGQSPLPPSSSSTTIAAAAGNGSNPATPTTSTSGNAQPNERPLQTTKQQFVPELKSRVKSLRKKMKKYQSLEAKMKEELEFAIATKGTGGKSKKQAAKAAAAAVPPPHSPADIGKVDGSLGYLTQQKEQAYDPKEVLEVLDTLKDTLQGMEGLQENLTKFFEEYSKEQRERRDSEQQKRSDEKKHQKRNELLDSQLADVRMRLKIQSTQNEEVQKQFVAQVEELRKLRLEKERQHKRIEMLSGGDSAQEQIKTLELDLNERTTELVNFQSHTRELEERVKSKDKWIATLQSDVEAKDKQMTQLQKEVDDLSLRNSQSQNAQQEISELQNKLDTLEKQTQSRDSELHAMTTKASDLQQQLQQQSKLLQQREQMYQTLKDQQSLSLSSEFVDMLIEEDNISCSSQFADDLAVQQLIKVYQVIDFFDLTKPDGLNLRYLFIHDQMQEMQQGKAIIIGNVSDFHALDHFSRALRGTSQNNLEEDSVSNAMNKFAKLMQRSTEECYGGITYKTLSDQIQELCSSSLFLDHKPMYPSAVVTGKSESTKKKHTPNPKKFKSSHSKNRTHPSPRVSKATAETMGSTESTPPTQQKPTQSEKEHPLEDEGTGMVKQKRKRTKGKKKMSETEEGISQEESQQENVESFSSVPKQHLPTQKEITKTPQRQSGAASGASKRQSPSVKNASDETAAITPPVEHQKQSEITTTRPSGHHKQQHHHQHHRQDQEQENFTPKSSSRRVSNVPPRGRGRRGRGQQRIRYEED